MKYLYFLMGFAFFIGSVCAQPIPYIPYKRVIPNSTTPAHRYYPYKKPYVYPRRFINPDPRLGVYLGFGFLSDFNIESKNNLTKIMKQGYGFDLLLGFRISQALEFEFSYGNLWMSDKTPSNNSGLLWDVSVDFKIYFIPGLVRFEPYFRVGLGYYCYVPDTADYIAYDNELNGVGLRVGAGIDLRLTRRLTLGFGLMYQGIYLNNRDSYWYSYYQKKNAFFSQLVPTAELSFRL